MDVDPGLLARARSGDADALHDLLARIRPEVVRRCRRFLPHPQDAEEAAQEALLTIATRLDTFTGRGSFGGWVNVVAGNQARMTYRSMRRRFDERGLDAVPEGADPARTSVVAGTRLDLLDAIEALEQRHPEAVEAFVMRDLGSLAYDEIADHLEVPLGTVKARIHTARAFVRERLGGDE